MRLHERALALGRRAVTAALVAGLLATGCSGAEQSTAGFAPPVVDGPLADVVGPDVARLLHVIPSELPALVVARGALLRSVAPSIERNAPHEVWAQAVMDAQATGTSCWDAWPSCDVRDAEAWSGWQERFGFPLSAVEATASVGWADDLVHVLVGDFTADDVHDAFVNDPERGDELIEAETTDPATVTLHTWSGGCSLERATRPDRPQGCPGTAFVADGLLMFMQGEPVVAQDGTLESTVFSAVLEAGFDDSAPSLADVSRIADVLAGTSGPTATLLSQPVLPTQARVPDSIRAELATLPRLPVPARQFTIRDVEGVEHLALVYDDDVDVESLVAPLTTILTSEATADAGLRLPPDAPLDVRTQAQTLVAAVPSRADVFTDFLTFTGPLALYGV